MKIAFISRSRDPSLLHIDSDGGGVTILNYALGLGKRGHDVDIYTSRAVKSTKAGLYSNLKAATQDKERVALADHVTVIRKTVNYIGNDYYQHSLDFASNLDSFERYDIVCIFHPVTAYGLFHLNKVPLSRTVLFPMLISDEYKRFSDISEKYVEIEKSIFYKASRICSPSRVESEAIMKKGVDSKKIFIIHRGFNERIFTYSRHQIKKKQKQVMLVCIGAIRPQKQQHIFIEIVKLLLEKGIIPKVRVVGENKIFYNEKYEKYYVDLRNKIKKASYENYFEFTGALSQLEISKILKTSDIAAFPSVAESFGKAVLEAMATGIPTIMSNEVGAYEEFSRSQINSLAVDPDSKSFANAVLNLLDDPDSYSFLSRECKYLANEFNWDHVTDKLEEFLKSGI